MNSSIFERIYSFLMKVFRFINTARNFHPDQIRNKIQYDLKKARSERTHAIPNSLPGYRTFPLPLTCIPLKSTLRNNSITILNTTVEFTDAPDWNSMTDGTLWNLRLNSFDFIHSRDADIQVSIRVFKEFIRNFRKCRTRSDSHCISQRLLNLIPFVSRNLMDDVTATDHLYREAETLAANPEFHLRNNHLLDNGFALVIAGIFFGNEKFYKRGEGILLKELDRQILPDGAHMELSAMYHSLVLSHLMRTLQALELSGGNDRQRLHACLREKAMQMCGWMHQLRFTNGEFPLFNDSPGDLTPSAQRLFEVAASLKIHRSVKPLKECGYRKFYNRHFELFMDVNGLSPFFAPGHAHADSLHIILNVLGEPFLIDTGVSTYEKSQERMYERSSRAHNTVTIGDKNQSDVYKSFRAGHKARIVSLQEEPGLIEAVHDGYRLMGCMHRRRVEFSDRDIIITDHVHGTGRDKVSAWWHVDKKCRLRQEGNSLISKFARINFEGNSALHIRESYYAPAFGLKLPAWEVQTEFRDTLITRISLPKTV